MKIFLIKTLVLISSTIFMFKAPMSMGIMLLIQTIISTLVISNMMTTSWMAMIVFLMFVGSLLILFMYMSSIASNEKFSSNVSILIISMMLLLPMEEMLSEAQTNEFLNSNMNKETMISLTKIYNKKTLMITILMFLYMFLTMIVVTKIIKIHEGPLRSNLKNSYE